MNGLAAVVAGAASAAASEIEPHRMAFGGLVTLPQQELAPAGLVDFVDTFASTGGLTRYTESTQGTISASGNVLTLSHAANQNDVLAETGSSFAVPQAWVQIDVTGIPTPCNSGYDNLGIGLVKDAGNFLFANIDRYGNHIRLQIKVGGSNTFIGSIPFSAWTTPFSFALCLVGNNATAFFKAAGGAWTGQVSASVKGNYDFTAAGALAGWRAGLTYANGGAAGVWNVANFRAGRFGRVGMRDMCVVTNPDGTPYFTGTSVFFTATCADPMGSTGERNPGGYTGVFRLDTATNAMTQTGVLFVNRSGRLAADEAAHVIAYPNGDRRLCITTWGDGFGATLQVLHKLIPAGSQGDILTTNSSVVSGMAALPLPLGASGALCYDPMLVWDAATGLWFMAYAICGNTSFSGSPFYIALATSPDLATWTLVGADSGTQGYEGARLIRANRKLWVMGGGPAGAGNTSRIYRASDMGYVGALPGAVFSGGTATQPHPQVFQSADGRHVVLFTFDGTRTGGVNFTWGQPSIQLARRFW